MTDIRPSTLTIGGVGMVLMGVLFIVVLFLDFPTLIKHTKVAFKNVKSIARRNIKH